LEKLGGTAVAAGQLALDGGDGVAGGERRGCIA
jgi:hypothetical protein